MFLTASNIFYYLRDAGLCTEADVVGEDFAVAETGRRNRNFVVTRDGAASLFVKQIPMAHPEAVASLRREAACARLAQSAGAGSELRARMPVLLRYDAVANVLVYRFVEAAENLHRRILREGPLGVDAAGRVGTALAACHSETSRPGALLDLSPALQADPPWILDIVQRPLATMPEMNEGRRRVVGAMQLCPEVPFGMERLRVGWRRLCLMHGDVKFDNVLVEDGPEGGALLVDWELADLGDPLWDVAGALVAVMQPWLLGAHAAGADAARRAVAEAGGALWTAYLRRVEPAAGPIDLDLLARLVAARFLLLAFELLPDAVVDSPHVGPVLATARAFFAAPLATLSAVLGLAGHWPAGHWPAGGPTLRAVS